MSRSDRHLLQRISAWRQENGLLRLFVLLPLPLLAIGSSLLLLYSHHLHSEDVIASGVHLFTLDLSGKTPEAARGEILQWAQDRAATLLTLHAQGIANHSSVAIRARTLGLGIDVDSTLQTAEDAGRTGWLSKIVSLVRSSKPDYPIAPTVTVDQKQLHEALTHVAHLTQVPPINARIVLLPKGGFGLKHEVSGRAIDVDAAASIVTRAWQQFNTPPAPSTDTTDRDGAATTGNLEDRLELNLPTQVIQPHITYNILHTIDSKLSSYSTWYAEGKRGHNIEVATEKIDGTLLLPGQIFSFNNTVGPRVLASGFEVAPVIIHGQLQPGVGGGICQVSGTLYNAALKAGLKTVLRNHHSFPVSDGGIPTGRDATVAYGELDMRFQNSLPYPVYIVGRAHGGLLTFDIFGHADPDRTVQLVRGRLHEGDVPVEIIHDPNLPPGRRVVEQEGRPDVRTVWYQIVRVNGKVVSQDVIPSHYEGQPEIVRIGVKASPAARQPKAHPLTVQPAQPPAPR
ncbi:VanW family protein [Chthonomonas calidirosea]|uniref:VanW family protein n=1 Tax=Chthonomonas calidirosea TaxID=454171 RepID=UPI0006ECBDD7|nr:VanW family protein [Chthonomonas calidirosea]CEK13146.1 uncharacterized vancomycin resistance protein [Chthonomonas calidirosea]